MRPRVCWVVKIGTSYWEGPFLSNVTSHRRRACEFKRIEPADYVARTVGGKIFRRTRRKSK